MYRNFDAQFFMQFPHKRRFGGFARPYFTARKLPQARVRLSGSAKGGEKRGAPFNNTAHDRDHPIRLLKRNAHGSTGSPRAVKKAERIEM
jgi:hypothetical protein